jgi:Flp pilus assembly protein TadG
MMRSVRKLWGNTDGAVAPLIALSLTALIGVGGLAFDYAHLAAMDTELQDAADHAALAAATQLDGSAGSQNRATQAAEQLITNETKFARDDTDHDRTVGIAQVTFYASYTSASSNTPATGDSDSKVVEVTVDTRAADYALTPVVGALYGSLNAKAVAGVSSAVCGVVPFFVCNPVEPAGNTNVNLSPGGVDPGVGMVLYEGGTQWGPGNFGFLDQIGTGANGVGEALASDTLFGNCSPTGAVTTKPGNFIAAVRDSLNMRFDYKPGNASACKDGPCDASTNVTKDVVLPNSGGGCAWQSNPATAAQMATTAPPKYFPSSPVADLPSGTTPQIMGYPRDRCHYFNTSTSNQSYPFCTNGRVGDGVWDRAAYFRSNHPGLNWSSEPGLGPNVTRYQTYLWEAADPATRLPAGGKAGNGNFKAFGQPQNQCLAPGLAPDPAGIDRRRITAAVVNCHAVPGLNGKKTLPVAGFIDLFLSEPVAARTKCPGCTVTYGGNTYVNDYASDKDIYVEIIGASGTGQGGAIPQITRRSIPHLIE